jgi:hypothetical protein
VRPHQRRLSCSHSFRAGFDRDNGETIVLSKQQEDRFHQRPLELTGLRDYTGNVGKTKYQVQGQQ